MKKLSAILLMLALLVSLMAGCGSTAAPAATQTPAETEAPVEVPAETEAPAEPEAREVEDFYGNVLTFSGDVTKIVTGKTVATHLVAITGGTEVLASVGQGFGYKDGALVTRVFPGLEGLTEMIDNDMNAEELLELQPDVVYISAGPNGNEVGEKLKEAGIQVAYYTLTYTTDVVKFMEMTAEILGTEEAAANAAAYIEYYRAAMNDVTVPESEEPPVVVYSRGTRGICGENSIPNEWITGLGAVNAGTELGITAFMAEVTAEEMLNLNPDVIFCENVGAKEMYEDPQFAGIKAVQNGQVYVVPYGMSCSGLATAENPLVWYYAANILYPESCNYDIDTMLKDFFLEFYNYEMNQEEIDTALFR